jgi:hypothetical protein
MGRTSCLSIATAYRSIRAFLFHKLTGSPEATP